MNQNFKNFLLNQRAKFENDAHIFFPANQDYRDKSIYPVAHLAVLTISGKDAGQFLQGQLTCDIKQVTEIKSSLGAFCNPKGRTISTLLLVKAGDAYLMVLPVELLELVKKRLQIYVLRSDVTLTDSSHQLCLIGLNNTVNQTGTLFATTRNEIIGIDFSVTQNRYLIIAETEKAIEFWTDHVNKQGFQPEDSEQWGFLDIISGIPWLTKETSEEFIPQMLNLDQLGGISFNKGCYTGQEIVARTHYLGKAKRAMFLAECRTTVSPVSNSNIIDESAGTHQVIGKVLQAQRSRTTDENEKSLFKMLIVLPVTDRDTDNLTLEDPYRNKITLLTLPL